MPAVSSYGHRATKPRKQGQRFKFVWVIWKQTAARLRAGQRQPRDMSDRMMERREEAEVQLGKRRCGGGGGGEGGQCRDGSECVHQLQTGVHHIKAVRRGRPVMHPLSY
ncbi:uncharacterized protein ACBT44_017717 isoform 1-T2 [Syngnathus typhle]